MTRDERTDGRSARERVVVTGSGATTPYGIGVAALERGLWSGQAAIRDLSLFDSSDHRTKIAAEVPNEDDGLASVLLPRQHLRLTRTDRFALAAAIEAEAQAAPQVADDEVAGLFFGSSTGGMFEGEGWYAALRKNESAPVSRLATHQYDGTAGVIARHFGLTGPVQTAATACSAAGMAIASAVTSVREGECDVAFAGGADALCQLTYAGFNSLRAVDEEPTRPFRADRGGLSLGEGAGILILESLERAQGRGASILAEIVGIAGSCDANHMTAPHPEGRGAAQALRVALCDAGLEQTQLDFVNAHGTGTPLNDQAESVALAAVMGSHLNQIVVTSTKGAIGHLLGACGAVEAVASIVCLARGSVHATPGGGEVDPECGVDLVLGEPRVLERCKTVASLNLAFGGANSALVLQRFDAPAVTP